MKNTLCVLLLSFLFVFLGLRPFRLLGSLHNVNALADILKLGNFGAGGFQLCISGFALRGKLGILFFPCGDRNRFHALRQLHMEIAACRVP